VACSDKANASHCCSKMPLQGACQWVCALLLSACKHLGVLCRPGGQFVGSSLAVGCVCRHNSWPFRQETCLSLNGCLDLGQDGSRDTSLAAVVALFDE